MAILQESASPMTSAEAIPSPISKIGLTHYMKRYKKYVFERFENEPITLFEIGIAQGDTMLLFRDALPKAKIVGLDIAPPPKIEDTTGRIAMYQGEQQDTALLDRIRREQAPNGFDVIIDDGSHVGQYTRIAFWHLFMRHLKPGGLYFIEDWGCSYWKNKFPDGHHYSARRIDFVPHEKALNAVHKFGKNHDWSWLRKGAGFLRYRLVKRRFPSHDYGMVGFLKELVDECGAEDITNPLWGKGAPRLSIIEEMTVSVGLVMVVKRPE